MVEWKIIAVNGNDFLEMDDYIIPHIPTGIRLMLTDNDILQVPSYDPRFFFTIIGSRNITEINPDIIVKIRK
jgi:hypothetical protein